MIGIPVIFRQCLPCGLPLTAVLPICTADGQQVQLGRPAEGAHRGVPPQHALQQERGEATLQAIHGCAPLNSAGRAFCCRHF